MKFTKHNIVLCYIMRRNKNITVNKMHLFEKVDPFEYPHNLLFHI